MKSELFKWNFKKCLLLVLSFALFFLFGNSASALTCTVDSAANCAATGKTLLLKMSATDNAHAEFVSESNYSNYICCSESGVTIDKSCSISVSVSDYDVFLKLQHATNSHVGRTGVYSAYTQNACISVDTGNIACSYATGGNNCLSGYECLAEISGDDNAHIGNCSTSYTRKICCAYSATPILSISASPSSITSGVATAVQFTVTSSGAGVNGATVTLTGGASGSCTTANVGGIDGICSITITATSPVTATASKTGYTSGATTVTVTAALVLSISAYPSSITQGVNTDVTFAVTSGGSPVQGVEVNFFVGGVYAGECPSPTNSNGECIQNLMSGGPYIDVVASKTGYTNGTTRVTVTAALVLSISASPSSITSSIPTAVQFTVISGGAGVNGATVTLTGGASGSCTTANVGGIDGICSITITATSPVIATASKTIYTNGTTTVAVGANACDTLNCDDSNDCTIDSCDYLHQICARNTKNCNDGDVCTIDSCNAVGGCANIRYTCTRSGCEATSVCNGTGGCNVTYYPPSCVSLTPAHQDSIRYGNITLTASTTCAISATIDNGFGAIPVNGSGTVAYNPPAGVYSTTYQMDLSGYGPSNDVSNACSAVVDLLPQCTLSANPTVVAKGDESDFRWTTMDADSSKGYNIDQGVGDVSAAPQPKAVLYINSPIDFTMTVKGFDSTPHTNTCSVHIDELTSCNLISPTTPTTPIVAGNPANISWTSTNASGGTITPPGSLVAASGNMNVNPFVTTTYKLDLNGTHSDTNFCAATVHVIPSVIPDCISLVADPSTLSLRNSLKLTWVTSGSISALIDNNVGYVAPTYGGDKFFYPTIVGSYPITMTVTSSSGATDTCSANITVTPAVINPKVELLKNAAGSIEQIMSNILGWALSVAGSLLLLIIIIGGALYISSTGEENKITAAKKTITWAIIGAILILAAYIISSIVYGFLGL